MMRREAGNRTAGRSAKAYKARGSKARSASMHAVASHLLLPSSLPSHITTSPSVPVPPKVRNRKKCFLKILGKR